MVFEHIVQFISYIHPEYFGPDWPTGPVGSCRGPHGAFGPLTSICLAGFMAVLRFGPMGRDPQVEVRVQCARHQDRTTHNKFTRHVPNSLTIPRPKRTLQGPCEPCARHGPNEGSQLSDEYASWHSVFRPAGCMFCWGSAVQPSGGPLWSGVCPVQGGIPNIAVLRCANTI